MTHWTNQLNVFIKKTAIATALCALSVTASADNNFSDLANIGQDSFQSIAENLAAATVYKAIAPAEPLGVTGFDVAVGLSRTEIDSDAFELASSGDWDLSALPLLRVSAQKGLLFNFDVGASYTLVPGTDINVLGAEVRYAIVDGGIATPAIAVRAAYSILKGVDELEFSNKSVDISISKGFLTFTPYAGIGKVISNGKAVGFDTLEDVEIDETRIFAGLNANFGINVGLEMDSMAGQQTVSAKVGMRF